VFSPWAQAPGFATTRETLFCRVQVPGAYAHGLNTVALSGLEDNTA
jgi:hypothetical protein